MENLTNKVHCLTYALQMICSYAAQALRYPVETTATSTSVEVRLHSSKAQVDATILDKHVVKTGYDQSGLPKVTNYVAYEQYYDSTEWTTQTRGIHVIVLDGSTVR